MTWDKDVLGHCAKLPCKLSTVPREMYSNTQRLKLVLAAVHITSHQPDVLLSCFSDWQLYCFYLYMSYCQGKYKRKEIMHI